MDRQSDDKTLQRYARLAGLMYVFTNAVAIFAHTTAGGYVVRNDPAATAANINASLSMFRLTIAGELVTIVGTIAIFLSLYVVLREVNRNLALLAAFWRLAENCILGAMVFLTLTAVEFASSGPYMAGADSNQLQVLMYGLLRVHQWGFQVGFLFLGLGSLVFSYLWFRSGFIPRWIAAWGMFASAIMAIVALVVVVYPPFYGMVTMAYMAPMGLYEIGLGFWLLIRGIRLPAADVTATQTG